MKVLLLFFLAASLSAQTITGSIVGVTDGDTVKVLNAEMKLTTVRLWGIDAPEKNQAFGAKSKAILSELVFRKTVRVEIQNVDRYKRAVGKIYLNDNDVNVQMIEKGYAWWYRQYAKKAVAYQVAEEKARNGKVGLWADKNPIEPWNFRKVKKKRKV